MMEVKDIVEYLNNEGFDTKVNDYGIIFVDVKKYGMDNDIMVDINGKEIICETPIDEEIDNKVIKPLSLMLGLTLIDYPGGRYTTSLMRNMWNQTDAEKELLNLIYGEVDL